jgi:hypothetical protein
MSFRGYITRYGRAADTTALEIYYPFDYAQDRFAIGLPISATAAIENIKIINLKS